MRKMNNDKTMSKARMAILAGTLALSMSPVVAIAQTQGTSTGADVSSVDTTTGTDTNRPPIAQFGNRGDSDGFRMMGERPEMCTNGDGSMAEPPARPEGDQAPELPEGEQPQLTGERPELPTNEDGTTAEPRTDGQAPTDADGTTGEAPTTPEGDQTNDGKHDRPFFDRIGDFFRQMFDWISGTGRK